MTITQTTTRILFHGKLAALFGRSVEIATPPGCSIAELRSKIAAEYPHAADALEGKRVRACVGNAIVPDSYRIAPGDKEVEFLPPVSGG
jgi:molybdopterin converting factor small subunit